MVPMLRFRAGERGVRTRDRLLVSYPIVESQ